jgi:hypothetical protein
MTVLTKKRPLPKHADFFLAAALKARLSHPLGRAIYACNGIQNGRWQWATLVESSYGMFPVPQDHQSHKAVVARLRTIKPSTAIRWQAHWKSGGSVKSLSHGAAGRVR